MFHEEIAVRLEDQAVGAVNESIFFGSKAILPTSKDAEFLTLIETGGTSPSRTQNDTATSRPSLQIATYAPTNYASRRLAGLAYAALGAENGLYNVVLSGTKYLSITCQQNPTDNGVDGVGRAKFTFNIAVEKAPS